MEYYLAMKKNGILPSVRAWMDLDSTMLREIGQTEKDKYHVISQVESKEQHK